MSTVGPGQDTKQYDALPESIKALYTFEEWMWLPSDAKAGLEANETMPEVEQ